MSNPFFKFKKFTIRHDKCAMKVGTDGVLLGAWCNLTGKHRILDVGTGTGLIALMLAQRSENTLIEAIDIDSGAYTQACENVNKSSFYDRIRVFHSSFDSFTPTHPQKYDLIVSNPPYFSTSLQGPDLQRNTARHDNKLALQKLIHISSTLLTPTGSIALILPFDKKEEINQLVSRYSLYIHRQTVVRPTPTSIPKRLLTELTFQQTSLSIYDELVIETTRHQYTTDYIALTKEFYLKM